MNLKDGNGDMQEGWEEMKHRNYLLRLHTLKFLIK